VSNFMWSHDDGLCHVCQILISVKHKYTCYPNDLVSSHSRWTPSGVTRLISNYLRRGPPG